MGWKPLPTTAEIDIGQMARLIGCIGQARFDPSLLDILNETGPVVEMSGLVVNAAHRPRPVDWCGRRADTAVRVARYVGDFHRYDPTLMSLPKAAAHGLWFNASRPGAIGHDEYRWICFEHPAFRRKISVSFPQQSGWTILNLYLSHDAVSDERIVRLAQLGSLVVHAGMRRTETETAGGAESKLERLAAQLGRRFPMLTERERHVCAMTMTGRSSAEIADALHIRRSTALTYRRRAYERLGIRSAAELTIALL